MPGLQNTIIKVDYIFTSKYLNVILKCIFSFPTAEDDAEYGYHSASSSSELERQQQRRVNQQRRAGKIQF